MKKYAYIRVSSRDQNIIRQQVAMGEIGIKAKQMYIDKQSGKDFERANYQRLVRKLKAGDELYVASLDRLGRDYEDIITQWRYLTKEKKIDIIVLDFPLLDTRRGEGGITGQFIADLALQIMSYVAQIERENIHKRQTEGIRAAKARGVDFGRPRLEKPMEFFRTRKLWEEGKISKRECARRLKTSPGTVTRWLEEHYAVKNCKKPKK